LHACEIRDHKVQGVSQALDSLMAFSRIREPFRRDPYKMTIEESKISWKVFYYWTGGVYMVVGAIFIILSF
jgi:hypothetical protein